jgi:hypothetical protein
MSPDIAEITSSVRAAEEIAWETDPILMRMASHDKLLSLSREVANW